MLSYCVNMCQRFKSICLRIFLLLIIFLHNILSFNIEELKAVNYEVDILQTPMKKGEQSIPVVHMTSIFGQEYQCILPHIEEEEISEKITYNEKNTDIKELLKPLHSGKCLLKAKDWWTYELCFGQYIKQFHIEDGQIIGQIITLGLYDSDYDWNNETDQEKFKHSKQRYHSQFYINGTKCDLTGQPRVTEVKVYCEEDAGDYIFRVDEPGTCSYAITVYTPRVCSHPQLKPLPSKKAHKIPCHPLLNEQQFSKYQAKLNEETAKANEKRNQWLTNQQEWLQVMKKETSQDDEALFLLFKQFYKELLDESKTDPELLHISGVLNNENGKTSDWVQDYLEDVDSDLQKNTEGEEENDLLQEYDKLLEKWKSILSSEVFAIIKNIADEQLFGTLDEEDEDKELGFKDDAISSINLFLKKLDKAEKDALKVLSKQVKEAQSTNTKAPEVYDSSNIAQKPKTAEFETSRKKNKIYEEKKKTSVNEEQKNHVDEDDDDELQVLIRKLDTVHSPAGIREIDSLQQKKLEKAVKENLEKSGINTGGRRIEVKIIKAGYSDNHLTDEEADQFQNMITALLTGEQEKIQEIERNKKLEENYKFTWKAEIEEESDEN